ncbi:MAG TPA: DUF3500 domain-containing protein [Pirellulales bacterium]|nr:DUF3500 domain-containing protein [Pirellulales bacterium]
MSKPIIPCPDCDSSDHVTRRQFVKTACAAGLAATSLPTWARAADKPLSAGDVEQPESIVKVLFESMSPKQKETVCFDWDYKHPQMGLLRTRVANNWHVTKPQINSDFYTKDQKKMIREIFEGVIQPEWHARIDQQLDDDAGGFGEDQNVAIFGNPGDGKFELVMTGRHMTLRCDGNSSDHVAFGGPIFYGHAAQGFDEDADHKGNVFWHQAVEANKLFSMMDTKQQQMAMVDRSPKEQNVDFQGAKGRFPGIPASEMSSDQRSELQRVLQVLIDPYRQSDRDEVVKCVKAQGGLDKCSLAFYKDKDIGNDRVWDNWRLEGPSFVWYFRGNPHVHCWVNIADDASVKTNA